MLDFYWMTMKTTSTALLCLTSLLLALPASAQVYQWKDASGRTVVSDTPPPGNVKPSQSMGRSPANAVQPAPVKEGAAPAAPASTAERDLDFKKRQKENQEKADKAAKEQTANAESQENCKRARQSLTTLESGQRMTTTNEKGEREFMDDSQRQAEIARARKIADDSCK